MGWAFSSARMTVGLSLLVALLAFVPFAQATAEESKSDKAGSTPPKKQGDRRALLVGCGHYDHFPDDSLLGPPHDIRVLSDVLEKSYHFHDMRILSDAAGPDNRPTYANIEREFKRLARDSRTGDRVFISLSGHGSQQPAVNDPKDPDNFEPDGLDEIFLPADVDSSADHKSVVNCITDNQVRDWLKDIRATGASIFIVFDACHSGSMVRGNGGERVRELKPERLTSEQAIETARASVFSRKIDRKPSAAESPFKLPPKTPDLVAIYASQSDEPTVEMRLPDNVPGAETYGLLTYTLCKVLSEAIEAKRSLTYTEVVEQIQSHYSGSGRSWPTPLVEGHDKDLLLFSDDRPIDRPPFVLSLNRQGHWFVNAGVFQGVTPGSILAVSSVRNNTEDGPIVGHVRVKEYQSDPLASLVEPWPYDNLPVLTELQPDLRCKPVFIDYQLARATLAVDPLIDETSGGRTTTRPMAAAERASLRVELDKAGQHLNLIKPVDDALTAQWLLRRVDSGQEKLLYLTPGNGDAQTADPTKLPALFGPIPREELASWLVDRMTKIARAQNLLRTADATAARGSSYADQVRLGVRILRLHTLDDAEGEPIAWGKDGFVFQNDQLLGIEITNKGKVPVDVSVLYIDSGFGIEPLFPASRGADNRLGPKDPPLKLLTEINATTTGLEHLVVIAVKSPDEGLPVDFTFLKSPTLEQARRGLRGADDGSLDSPLGKLLQTGLYAQGGTRGMSVPDAKTSVIRAFNWRVMPTNSPATPNAVPTN
jgi:hypothetical protein